MGICATIFRGEAGETPEVLEIDCGREPKVKVLLIYSLGSQSLCEAVPLHVPYSREFLRGTYSM